MSFVLRPFLVAVCVGGLVFGVMRSSMFAYDKVPEDQFKSFITNLRTGAHRGLSDDAPENTLEALKKSQELGADAVEFDIAFTKDGVAVLMHDDTVDRTTDGVGKISDLTWAQVKNLNAAANFNGIGYTTARVPTLEEAVEYSLSQNLKIFFDIKSYQAELGPTFAKLFEKHRKLYTMSAVCSFDPRVPFAIKKADAKIITGLTWRPYFLSYEDVTLKVRRNKSIFPHIGARIYETVYIWSLHNWLWKLAGAQLILAHDTVISPSYLKMWRDRGLEVVAWTVNDFDRRVHYYRSLKSPFLTDRMGDFQQEMKKGPS